LARGEPHDADGGRGPGHRQPSSGGGDPRQLGSDVAEGERADQDSGATACRRLTDTAKKARTMTGSNWAPAHAASSARAACADIGLL
jgi:hypothetical protein